MASEFQTPHKGLLCGSSVASFTNIFNSRKYLCILNRVGNCHDVNTEFYGLGVTIISSGGFWHPRLGLRERKLPRRFLMTLQMTMKDYKPFVMRLQKLFARSVKTVPPCSKVALGWRKSLGNGDEENDESLISLRTRNLKTSFGMSNSET
jgi:hypothetical protein